MLTSQDRSIPPPGLVAVGARGLGPDTELLALWTRFLALMTAGRDLDDEAFDPISREMAAIERRLATLTAATLEGVAVLLRVGFLRGSCGTELQDRYLGGRVLDDPPPDLDPVLWRALVSIERQTGILGGSRAPSAPRRA